jgi:hypothetical protein
MQQPPAIRLFFTFFFTILATAVFSQAKINGKMIKERQSLSKALRPEADE